MTDNIIYKTYLKISNLYIIQLNSKFKFYLILQENKYQKKQNIILYIYYKLNI